MGLPINIEDCVFGLEEEGVGLHKDTMAEVSEVTLRPNEPVTKRRVAGHRGVKHDQRFEDWEGTAKVKPISGEAIDSAIRNQDAYIAGRAMPRRTVYLRERYRDTGGLGKKYQLLNLTVEHGQRQLGDDGTYEIKLYAERVVAA